MVNSAAFGTSRPYPRSWTELPALLYVHQLWDDESRQAWNEMLPWQRLDSLSARGNALHWRELVMPISLNFEKLSYKSIRVYKNKSQIVRICLEALVSVQDSRLQGIMLTSKS